MATTPDEQLGRIHELQMAIVQAEATNTTLCELFDEIGTEYGEVCKYFQAIYPKDTGENSTADYAYCSSDPEVQFSYASLRNIQLLRDELRALELDLKMACVMDYIATLRTFHLLDAGVEEVINELTSIDDVWDSIKRGLLVGYEENDKDSD